MTKGKQIAAYFGVAALGAGIMFVGEQQAEKQKWRATLSGIMKPKMVEEFSRDTQTPVIDGRQYGRPALTPASRADSCVIDSFTNAVADYISPDPAALIARAGEAVQNRNSEVMEEALKKAATDIGGRFEVNANSCPALAKTPAERDHAATIRNEITQTLKAEYGR